MRLKIMRSRSTRPSTLSATSQTSFYAPLYKDRRCLIRHDSLFKAVWDWVILAFVIYTTIEIPFDVAFVRPRQDTVSTVRFGSLMALSPIAIVNLIVDLFFIIDIPINFRSASVDKSTEEVISDPKKIAVLYLKSWFVVDFVAAIPFEFLADPQHEGATTLMGLLKTARLLRLVRVTRKIDRYSEYGLAVILLLTCLFMLTGHWLACIWHAVGTAEAHDDNGWLAILAKEIDKPINHSIPSSGPSLKSRYLTSLYFTMSSLTSVGFGNIAPSTNHEKIFAIIVMLMGALMYASIFGNLTVIIQRLYVQSSKQHEDLRITRDFVRFFKIPRALQENLENHVLHESCTMKVSDINQVLSLFPGTLQTDICLHIHGDLFISNSAFRAAVPSCKRSLATKLKVQHFLPRQYVIKQGDEVDRVYFIIKGIVHILEPDGETLLALGRGDTIYSEHKSMERKARAVANILVQRPTDIHYIEWSDLMPILEDYPVFREDFLARMVFAYQIGDYIKEEDEADLCEGSPRSLEPKSEIYHSIQVESSNLDEDKHNSLVQASKSGEMNDFEEHLKLIDRRLSNMERKMSILLPLMKKTLKDDV
ncbi:potassium voltage-gated channel unc-103-like [Oculina patagonica]